MAVNIPGRKVGRRGAIKKRSQLRNPRTRLWEKRSKNTGRFMDDKTTGGVFKNVRKEE